MARGSKREEPQREADFVDPYGEAPFDARNKDRRLDDARPENPQPLPRQPSTPSRSALEAAKEAARRPADAGASKDGKREGKDTGPVELLVSRTGSGYLLGAAMGLFQGASDKTITHMPAPARIAHINAATWASASQFARVSIAFGLLEMAVRGMNSVANEPAAQERRPRVRSAAPPAAAPAPQAAEAAEAPAPATAAASSPDPFDPFGFNEPRDSERE
eukprot:tig00020675_g12623.t1